MRKTKTKTTSKLEDTIQYILCLFFPNRCKFCGKLTDAFEDVCEDCQESLPWITGEICKYCGSMKADCGCGKRHGQFYEEAVAPLYYEDKVKSCIYDYKFFGEKLNYKALSELMSETCRKRYCNIMFDYITYIPMSKKKQKKRGYNQSELLAKQISKNLDIDFGKEMIVKLYDTDNQHDCKSEIERKGNLFGVFDINKSYNLKDKTVLIVDDIKTTGITLSECGKMLYLNGAKDVFCLTTALSKSKIKKNTDDNQDEKEGS